MIRRILGRPLRLTAAAALQYLKLKQPYETSAVPNVPIYYRHRPSIPAARFFSTESAATNLPQTTELTRVATVVDGCDYEHWLVVMEPPKGYPERSEIVHQYITTLAMALGSEEEAKKSIYSVSTKYYYAFGCNVPEILTQKLKSLPNVRWVLPDSYLCHGENGYGGEPFVDGGVVSYDEKYHEDWLRDKNDDKCQKRTRSRKAKRKRKEELNLCKNNGLQTFESSGS